MKSLISAVAVLAVSVSTTRADTFSAMVNFGDSLSDVGNVHDLTTDIYPLHAIVPAAPYYNGHFSNGPIWVEQLAGLMGLPTPTPSRTGGTDYAYGLAHSGTGNTSLVIPNVQTQINDWTANNVSSQTQLFTVLGGATDLFDVIGNAGDQSATAQQAANNIVAGLQSLYNDGARNIIVGNLPDLGLVPSYHNTPDQTQATALSNTFNTTLATGMSNLIALSPGLNLHLLDLNTLFNNAIANPATYGLTNVTDAAYTGDPDYEGVGTVVPNPAGYLFWDEVHPTTLGHSMVAQAAYAAVPEPATTMLIILPAAAMMMRRRKMA
ncbi:MAG: SGNH/GDSL hydrolase family protein [Phycisphaerales bacterium]|jgi:outer membrane lipase/esterase|nr:SGNH/GDSL hydrolase family protein [Phycisphaerales bacterium]